MDLVLRAIVVFAFVLLLTRVIGKRELSTLQPIDLVLLIVPLVSSTAIFTSESCAICCLRASSATSSIVNRSRFRLRSITSPLWTTMSGSPSRIGRERGNRYASHEVKTCRSAIVLTTRIAPVGE